MKLEVNDLRAGYGRMEVLHAVSLQVSVGECVAVVGPNGAGKSTLLNAIVGRVPVTDGSISWSGRDVTGLAPHKLVAEGLALVPEGRHLFTELSVKQNLVLAHRLVSASPGGPDVDHVLDLFPSLQRRVRVPAGRLSGGEQQMLAIARALVLNPRLIMLDEPSIGLAPLIVREVMDVVLELLSSEIGVLIVEQNMRELARVAETVYVLERGQVVRKGSADEVLDAAQLRESYLGADSLRNSLIQGVEEPMANRTERAAE
ncbi:MAG: ABC transporter ATP-binding protein [Dehalococcoidia bacterium]